MNATSAPPQIVRQILIPLAVATAFALLIVPLIAERIEGCLLPVHRAVFELLAREFRVTRMATEQVSSHRVVRVEVTLADTLVLGHRTFRPDPRGVAQASTPVAHTIHAMVTALLVSVAWPAADFATRLRRSLLAFALSAGVAVVDAPSILAGTLWQTVLDSAGPGRFSLLTLWAAFLEGGGRLALGILAGASAAAIVGATRAGPPVLR